MVQQAAVQQAAVQQAAIKRAAIQSADGGRLDAKRHAILLAASNIFRQRGFHETGMRDIASSVGMTVGNLYYYFKHKQDLLAFCQETALKLLIQNAEEVKALDASADQKLWHLVVGHLWCLNESTPGSLAHLEVESLAEGDRERIISLRDGYEQRIEDFIVEGQQEGVFVDSDPKLSALQFLGAVNWTVKWFRRDGRYPLIEIARQFATQLVRGLVVDGRIFKPPETTSQEDVGTRSDDRQAGDG